MKNEDSNKLPSIFETNSPQTGIEEMFQLKTRTARMDQSIEEEKQSDLEDGPAENTSKIDQLGQEVDDWLSQLAPTSVVENQPERKSTQTQLRDKEIESSTPTSSASGAISGRPPSIAINGSKHNPFGDTFTGVKLPRLTVVGVGEHELPGNQRSNRSARVSQDQEIEERKSRLSVRERQMRQSTHSGFDYG